MESLNLGEGIAFAGILIAVGLSRNYWLLIALILPLSTWGRYKCDKNNEANENSRGRI